MIKKIFYTSLPSWVLLLFVALTLVAIGVFVVRFGQVTYNYDLFLPNQNGEEEMFEYGAWPALGNAKFFGEVKDKLVSDKADFVLSDLSDMKLQVYKAGTLVKEVKILSKGREGSWWETPAGIYKIQTKEEEHFSSFGRVYMPWSMAFQGNFFIHGWPYYPSGEPVGEGYSGGCIRLSTADAEAVFALVETGTPVLVFEKDFLSDSYVYRIKRPEISAKAYLAADLKSNFVFLEKNSKEKLPIASLVKLVTATVATEYINLDREILITQSAVTTTSIPRLKVGQEFSTYNLLYPLLLESSNEAALAISRILGPIRFVELMNAKAGALGMKNTNFVDPTGAGEENVSTAEDLFSLAKYLYNNRSFVLKISSQSLNSSAYGTPVFKDLRNLNVFKGEPGFVGGKVGETTAALGTILSVFEFEIGEEARPIVIIVLGSSDREKDARTILDYVRSNYQF